MTIDFKLFAQTPNASMSSKMLRNGRSRKWTKREDEKVRQLVQASGPGDWVSIANELNSKTPKQVGLRFILYRISVMPFTHRNIFFVSYR